MLDKFESYQDLKNSLRYEYKLKTGQYYTLALVGFATTEVDIMAEVVFDLNHYTMLVLSRTVSPERTNVYTVNKVISITRKGEIFEFKNIEELVEYVKSNELVALINKY